MKNYDDQENTGFENGYDEGQDAARPEENNEDIYSNERGILSEICLYF